MLKSVPGRALLCYVPKKKNLGHLIYRNDADVLGSCHSLFLANHRSSKQLNNQITTGLFSYAD
jgi:hypothetical protein